MAKITWDVRQFLHTHIENNAIFRANPELNYGTPKKGTIYGNNPGQLDTWMFMMRRVTQDQEALDYCSNLVCNKLIENIADNIESKEIQLVGVEVSSVPLIAAIQQRMALVQRLYLPSFVVKKERDGSGLFPWVEGPVDKNRSVVFVDDIYNTGTTYRHCMSVCVEELGLKIGETAYTVVNLNDRSQRYYIDYIDNNKNFYSTRLETIFYKDEFNLDYDSTKYWEPPTALTRT